MSKPQRYRKKSVEIEAMSDYVAPLSNDFAERAYDFMVLLGLDPVPWQHALLKGIEQQSFDQRFREMAE